MSEDKKKVLFINVRMKRAFVTNADYDRCIATYYDGVIDHEGVKYPVKCDAMYSATALEVFKEKYGPVLEAPNAVIKTQKSLLQDGNRRINELLDEVKSLEGRLAFSEACRENQKKSVQALQTAVDLVNCKVRDLTKGNEGLRQLASERADQIQELSSKHASLVIENDKLKREAAPTLVTEFLRSRNSEIRKLAEERYERIKTMDATINDLNQQLGKRGQRVIDLERQLSWANGSIKAKDNSLAVIVDRERRLRESHSDLVRANRDLQQRLEYAKNQSPFGPLDDLRAQLSAVEVDNKSLRDALLTARTKLKVLSFRIACREHDAAQLSASLKDLANEADRFFESTNAKCKEHKIIPS